MVERVECVVIGAGAVGLAVARALALAGREVVLLEKARAIGTETSSRNSEVIHAGIYYPTGSLKARLCVAGKLRLYEYLPAHGIPYKRLGKLIVATDETQIAALERLKRQADANGVTDLVWLDRAQALALEPALNCVAALLSPSTGIMDSHGLMLSFQGEAEDHGAMVAFESPVVAGWIERDGFRLEVGGAQPSQIECRLLVNSAGLYAQAIARKLEGLPAASVPGIYYARGCYFGLAAKAPFTHLIYPAPEEKFAGLGHHLTLDLAGRARFGPDVEWIDRIDYTVDPKRAAQFYEAVRRYWPGLQDGTIAPDFAGVRPKLRPKGEAAADFVIQGPREHGVAGLVNLYGIESPGLTSSMAIADEVTHVLDGA
ncbi:MAG TPA: NAD(P)/FAD-dependent oxidoreductase [Alphaproteobacteria bacterium]|nr:NAD(P)/FAD-dependent oxidoreductase [Alphaproteobacteria bacterium]